MVETRVNKTLFIKQTKAKNYIFLRKAKFFKKQLFNAFILLFTDSNSIYPSIDHYDLLTVQKS